MAFVRPLASSRMYIGDAERLSVSRGITTAILCGGDGTRLWPASRNSLSKRCRRLLSETLLLLDATWGEPGGQSLASIHRLVNPGRMPRSLIEVQSGCYLGEDEIARIDDGYGG